MRRQLFLFVLFLALLSGRGAYAAKEESSVVPTGIHIHCACEDELGKAYVEAVKSLIGQHAEYRMISFDRSADPGVVDINVISMPVHAQDGRTHTMLSIVITHDGTMTHEMLEACERNAAEEYARNTVAGLHGML